MCLFLYTALSSKPGVLLDRGFFHVVAQCSLNKYCQVRFLSEAGQRRYEFIEVGTLYEFHSRSSSEPNFEENWRNLWMTPQGFIMIHGKTDLTPFIKLSYCEFDCNSDDFAKSNQRVFFTI
jgi:hypothetical protein